MASSTSTVKVVILGDSSSAQRAAAAVNGAFKGMEGRLATVSNKLKSVGSGMRSFGSDMTRYVTVPLIAAGVLAVKEFSELQQVTGQTRAAIKSTGGAANVTAGHVKGLADKVGTLSAQEDDLVQSALNVLLTFTDIRNEAGKGNKIFDQTALAVANISARMDQDLKSSAVQVGKALNDPIKGLTSLTRIGVQFTDGQRAMIEKMVESGDKLGAQKIILAELNKEFGGSAKAAGDAASPFTRLALIGKDLAESFGKFIVPALQAVADWVQQMVQKFDALSPTAQKFIVIGLAIAAALGPLIIILGALATGLGVLLSPIGLVIAAVAALVAGLVYAYTHSETFRDIVNGAFEAVGNFAKDVWPKVEKIITAVFDEVLAFAKKVWPDVQKIISTAMDFIKAVIERVTSIAQTIWNRWGDNIMRAAETVWNLIKGVIEAALKIIRGVIEVVTGIISGDWGKVWTGIKNILAGVWDAMVAVVKAAVGLVHNIITAAWDLVRAVTRTAWERVKDIVSGVWDGIKSLISNRIQAVKENISNTLDNIKGLWSNVWNSFKDTVSSAWSSIKSIVSSAIDYLIGRIQALLNAIDSVLSKVPGLSGISVPGLNVTGRAAGSVASPKAASTTGGYGTANIYFQLDGRTVATALAQPLADVIYARTGIRS